MDQTVRVILFLIVGGAALTALAGALVYWMEPSRRIARGLTRLMGARPDAVASAPVRGQGVGLSIDASCIGVIRGPDDAGLVYGLDELIGAELIFDGQVAARAFRNEGRKPLDRIDPEAARVTLRVVFDDPRDPDCEIDLCRPDDPPRAGWEPAQAVQHARRFFTRIEVLVRR